MDNMQVAFDGQKLTIDNIIDVTKKGNDYAFQCGYYNITVSDPSKQTDTGSAEIVEKPDTTPTHDPHYYANGNNGLTVEDSAYRAYDKIINMWSEAGYSHITIGSYSELYDDVKQIIVDGEGRHRAYAIAGAIKKGVQEGRFKGVPLFFLFRGIAQGHITEPQKVEAKPKSNTSSFFPKIRF